jgi:hypothetical protein
MGAMMGEMRALRHEVAELRAAQQQQQQQPGLGLWVPHGL